MENSQAAVICLTLSNMDNDVLAAAHLAMSGFGTIGKGCNAYYPMLKANLIHENGKPTFEMDDFLHALTNEITGRMDRRGFN